MSPETTIAVQKFLWASIIYGRLLAMVLATGAFAFRRQRLGFGILGYFFVSSLLMTMAQPSPAVLVFSYLLGLLVTIGFFAHEWFLKAKT